MKKRRIIVIALVVIILASCVVSYLIPICSFRRNVKRYKKYVVSEEENTLTHVGQRLEMSLKEYQDLKQELINEGWQCNSVNQSGALAIPRYYRETHEISVEILTQQYSCDFIGHMYDINVLISSNNIGESLDAVIFGDIVLVEYRASLSLPFLPIGGKVH